MVRYHFKDRYQSAKKRSKRCSSSLGTSLRSILKHSRIPLLNRPTPYTAATNSDIWTEQRLTFSGQPLSHPSKFNEWSGFVLAPPINGRW